jgi:small-conductance mechanosensitive channel
MNDSAFGKLAISAMESIEREFRLLLDPHQWWQIGILILVLPLCVLFARRSARVAGIWFANPDSALRELGATALRELVLPLSLSAAALTGMGILESRGLPHELLRLAAVLALSLAAIRATVYILKHALHPGPLLVLSERAIAWLIWGLVALYLLGWLEAVSRALDSIVIPFGKTPFSLLDTGRVIFTLLAFVIVAAYLGMVFERRLMASSEISIGVRVGVVKFTRFFLIVIAVVIALNAVGVDLTALTVFGGALGVGVGFGLQRIASNFISGFILVSDRSIRQGDVISIGTRFGVVRELRARYVVVRDRDGVDTLIPNENMITSEVVNWSYADRVVRLKLPVQISYADNPRKGLEIMRQAALAHARVARSPEPVVRIIGFADSGIDLELRFWISDPEDGVNNVRSDLFLAIWDAFQAEGVTIPYPQRDLHLRSGWPAPGAEQQENPDG